MRCARWSLASQREARWALASEAQRDMQSDQQGRLSPEYVQEILSLAAPDPPAVAARGRLASDYAAAVAEMLNNPGAVSRVVLDERFDRRWPDDHAGVAQAVDGGFRLTPRDAPFIAVGAPLVEGLRDVVVGATFHKMGGPPGAAYGLVIRRYQPGRYYLAQVRDGEVAIWRREQEQWVELVPWTRSTAARPAEARNDLSFEVVGARLTFVVNGMPVATTSDAVLERGGVGVFVSGEGSDVLLERFVVRALV